MFQFQESKKMIEKISNPFRAIKNFLSKTAFITLLVFPSFAASEEINIYSHRQPFLINPFLEAFTKKTGIETNVVYSTKGLAQRLKAEGQNSPAEKAGIKPGDVSLDFNGNEVTEMRKLPRLVAETKVNSKSNVTIWRNEKKKSLNIVNFLRFN